MTKLATVKPRLGNLSHRMRASATDERERTQQRDEHMATGVQDGAMAEAASPGSEARPLHLTAHWRAGDGQVPGPNSAVANHKIPRPGDPTLFSDPENIETVSKAFHDREIQAAEQRAIKGVWY